MSFQEIYDTVETQFGTAWDDSTIPLRIDNVQKASGTVARLVTNLDEYVHLRILPAVAVQAEMATNPYKRLDGHVQVDWFGKSGRGTRNGYIALDTAKDIFEFNTFSNITFRPGTIVNIGEQDGFYQLTLSIPYFTYTKT